MSAPTLHPLSPVMLGTMTLGNQSDEAEAHAQLDEFLRLGGVWIDTAELYPVPATLEKGGETERIIGRWIAENPHVRNKIALATKIAGPTGAGNSVRIRELDLTGKLGEPSAEMQDLTPAQIRRALEASLKRLQTDYIDLYQLHWPTRPAPLWGEETFTQAMANGEYGMRPAGTKPSRMGVEVDVIVKTMGELIKEGKILAWGLSNETAFGITLFCESAKRHNVPLPLTVQNDFSLLDRRFDGSLAEAASYYNVKLLAYGPLCGGTLTGKYFAESDPKKWKPEWRHQRFPAFQKRYHAPKSMEAAKKYAQVAKEHNLTLVELALGFVATRFYLGSVIIGGNSVEHIREDYAAVVKGPKNITPEVEKAINRIHDERPNPNVIYAEL